MAHKTDRFTFRKHASIGAADAIEDKEFLLRAFVDNGELGILADKTNPKCVIVGRTGVGKTALLEMIKEREERVIQVSPEGLALNYLSNNTALSFYTAAGVDMDLFYRLLWRHIFAVEIIREHFNVANEQSRDSFIERIRDRFKNSREKQDAIKYLLEWGETFWQETEYRVKEITTKLEQELHASTEATINGMLPGVSGSAKLTAGMADSLSEEQKAEIVQLGQAVVNKVQIKTLSDIMDILNVVVDDPQKTYFITIDRLDETWVSDELRYHLIRALIDTVRDFNNKIENVKILVALRVDLLGRVFRYTRTPGYQEEKYQSMYLKLSWSSKDLEALVNLRVDKLVKEQYTKKTVTLRDLLPSKIEKANPITYFFDRTLSAPRDAIMFFNECIEAAEGKPKLTQTAIRKAEIVYSTNRLRALADEWSSDYSNFIELAFFVRGLSSIFTPVENTALFEERMLEFLIGNRDQDYIFNLIEEKFNSGEIEDFVREMISILFKVGVLGVRQEKASEFSWSFTGYKPPSNDFRLSQKVKVHPAFYYVLETNQG